MSEPRRERSPHQLPPGRHGLPRDLVAENQRHRLVSAMPVVIAERGYVNTAIDHIIREAGVSRRTFYEHFENKEVAFAAAYAEMAADVLRHVHASVRAERTPAFAGKVTIALGAVLDYVAAHEVVAQMLLVEVLAAGAEAQAQRAETLNAFTTKLDEAAKADRALARVPPLVPATVVGGIYEALYSRVVERRTDGLPEALPDLAYFTLLPYVGPDDARKEYQRLKRRLRTTRRTRQDPA